MPLRSRHAFTLIEMLVVISIITLLLAIAQPSLQQSRKHSRTVKCATQVAQMSWAVTQFADSNRGRLFPMVHAPKKYWIGMLAPYWSNNSSILLCDEANEKSFGLGSATTAWGPGGGWMDDTAGSFGMNLWLLPSGDFSTDPNMRQEGYIRHVDYISSDTPVFADSQWVGAWPDDKDYLPKNLQNPPNTHALGWFMSRFCVDRHIMRINVGFADGSARAVSIPGLWQLKWHRTFKPGVPVPEP